MRAFLLGSTALALSLSVAPAAAQQPVVDGQLNVTGLTNPNGTANTPAFRSNAGTIPGAGLAIAAQTVAASAPSPYAGTLTLVGGSAAVRVFCVDMLNGITIPSANYAVKATSLFGAGALTTTRYTDASALTRYKQASYLASFWNPTMAATDADDLQIAIWSVMGQGFGGTTGNLVPTTVVSVRAQEFIARANAAASANFANVSFANAYVLTDAAVSGVATTNLLRYDGTGRQEFVTAASVVPEPSTYAMLGLGLAGVIGVARRRRQVAPQG